MHILVCILITLVVWCFPQSCSSACWTFVELHSMSLDLVLFLSVHLWCGFCALDTHWCKSQTSWMIPILFISGSLSKSIAIIYWLHSIRNCVELALLTVYAQKLAHTISPPYYNPPVLAWPIYCLLCLSYFYRSVLSSLQSHWMHWSHCPYRFQSHIWIFFQKPNIVSCEFTIFPKLFIMSSSLFTWSHVEVVLNSFWLFCKS